jgi:mRNA-degrading endonuclease YafQ of YafQ-DinJ toxin-antitoxin module
LSRSEVSPLRPGRTNAFKKDLERCKKRGYDMDTARVVMGRLIHRETLEPVYSVSDRLLTVLQKTMVANFFRVA